MSFRRAAKTDGNHTDCVALFRKLGWYVLNVSQLKNCCDIIVSKHRRTIAIEIKDGKKPPSARKLSDGEEDFKNQWQGEWMMIISTDEILRLNDEHMSRVRQGHKW